MAMRDLGRRLAVAGVGIPIGVALIWMGAWPVAIVLGAVAAAGTAELFRLAEARGSRPFRWVGIPASGLLVVGAAHFQGFSAWSGPALALLLAVAVVTLGLAVFRRRSDQAPLGSVATTLLGAVYVGGTLAFAVHLRSYPFPAFGATGWEGPLALFGVFAISWCGDTGAYFAGHRFGRRKLLPAVSPAKTVEGGVGGLAAAAGAAVLIAIVPAGIAGGFDLAPAAAAVFGVVIGAVSQVGDLVESLLKREAGVKDSGGLFPGHGGVLDRFDGIFFALPVGYHFLPLLLP